MKCATPRNRSRSKRIDEHSLLQVRCSGASLRSRGEGGRDRETVSRLPRGGRKHSYTSSDRIRNDTEVEEVETEMAPTFRARTERGRTQAVDFEFERSSVGQLSTCELPAIGCGDRLPPVGQTSLPSGARKLASIRHREWRNDFEIGKTIDGIDRCDGYRLMREEQMRNILECFSSTNFPRLIKLIIQLLSSLHFAVAVKLHKMQKSDE